MIATAPQGMYHYFIVLGPITVYDLCYCRYILHKFLFQLFLWNNVHTRENIIMIMIMIMSMIVLFILFCNENNFSR